MPARAPRPRPGDTQFVVKPRKVCRTLAISCEAAIWAGLVSCIALLGSVAALME
jgi:hypothetical protein